MPRSTENRWLHRFACLTALVTLVLIGVGGLVTSKGVGMSVPDWPTTYGYNMFFFPFSKWVGGIFYEHTHRLVASGVGLMTTVLAVWLWVRDSRRWMRWLGVAAFFAVVLQGVLGGLRVVLFKDQIGVFHAALAQMFFVLVSALALFTSRWWRGLAPERDRPRSQQAAEAGGVGRIEPASSLERAATGDGRAPGVKPPMAGPSGLAGLFLLATLLVFCQLVVAATMRHQHAGLSIPDFPLAYHKLWPPMDAASVAGYNQNRQETTALNPITAFQIGLQMVHRILALTILCAVAVCARTSRNRLGARHFLTRICRLWLVLIAAQGVLGAFTIWSNKAADVATAHVVLGALCLLAGALLTILAFRVLMPFRVPTRTKNEPAAGLAAVRPAGSGAK